jgi:hypothetical protein
MKPCHGAPYGLFYRELRQAISYARWIAQDFENAEIRVISGTEPCKSGGY